jgi:thiol:disulfide interchange protein DsbD
MIRALLLCLALGVPVAQAASPQDLLEPEQAFRFSARALAADAIEVRFEIAEGYYLYRERFKFTAHNARLGAPQLPAGERKKDEFFGDTEVFRKEVRIRVPVAAGAGEPLQLAVTSQGCADAGVCYVPMESEAALRLAGLDSAASLPGAAPAAGGGLALKSGLAASDLEVAALFGGSAWLVLASFLGFGLLLAFTPCVLPMIPILSGIIAGEGARVTKARALALSSSYVLGMAAAYAAAGVAAASSGALLAASLQNAWVLGAFALVFVLLALSMFGAYELQLPGFLRHPLAAAGHRLRGGKLASVAGMGVLSAVIVSPCVAAPLAGALLYISQTRDVALGGTALFAMALGMGLPLLAVGVSGGALLPRAGRWMNGVKKFFGVLLLAVAAWIASPLFLQGKGDTRFVRVASVAELDAQLVAPGRPVMLDFYADWCVSCKEMEAFTFSDARVKAKLEHMRLLQVDVTANSAEDKALLKRFSLFGPPGIIFFDAQGREIRGLRVIGYQNAERFLKTLELAAAP